MTRTRDKRDHLQVPAAALDAWDRLAHALHDADGPVPCAGDDWERWTSPNARVRAAAIADCAGCAVRAQCGDYADAAGEVAGVWAGKDRTIPTRKPRRRQRKANTMARLSSNARKIDQQRSLRMLIAVIDGAKPVFDQAFDEVVNDPEPSATAGAYFSGFEFAASVIENATDEKRAKVLGQLRRALALLNAELEQEPGAEN